VPAARVRGYQEFQSELERQPVGFLALDRRFPELLDDARSQLAAWEFVTRRTGAVLVRRPFAELDPGPRTRIVFCSHIK